MAKRGYKLQEFVAHAGNVNCLSIGKKNGRVFITGGDDQKVNLWSIGKPTSLMTLCGHTSPIESVAFDSGESFVAAGSSSGTIKLWDLEETKMVRSLTGHRSYCTAIEFHPFGEFLASGSMDTNLKIWDIRKKGCIHTYKGHTRGISTIRFTPDGRWVVSGGFDSAVKVWDLTAGKLLHDFKFHEGQIRSIDFHPFEFLLATGSADKTVKFWDLETFEMIGSTRREAKGVRSVTFHPDGRTLFCGLDDSLKVYSWEPVICHDSVDMGWSTIGDLCIHDGRLLGGACYENSVAVWVADISLIEPYGARLPSEKHIPLKKKSDSRESPLDKGESYAKSKSNLHPTPPDTESKEIKTIYVDGVDLVASKKAGSLESPNIALPSCTKEINTVGTQKQGSVVTMPAKSSLPPNNKSRTVPSIIPRDGPDAKELFNSRRESIVSVNARGGIRTKPTHTRRLSNNQFDMERMLTLESTWHGADDNLKDPLEGRRTKTETVKEKLGTELLNRSKAANSVRLVNGVAVAHGRTRSLVERFESKEMLSGNEMHAHDSGSRAITELVQTSPLKYSDAEIIKKEEPAVDDNDVIEVLNQNHDVLLSTFRSRLTKLQAVRYIWDRNDVEGAVNALKKLPEHSVQADFISILLRRMEIITLDLFSCLLPVLVGLLESKVERHANISLEMLLKLVAVFGPLVRSTVSAPPAIGVDLHAEQRRECCKECFVHFQNIQRILPALIRKGGVVAKSARELNLVLQET